MYHHQVYKANAKVSRTIGPICILIARFFFTAHAFKAVCTFTKTRNLSKAHETRESLQYFQFSSYSFENRISLGLGPSGP